MPTPRRRVKKTRFNALSSPVYFTLNFTKCLQTRKYIYSNVCSETTSITVLTANKNYIWKSKPNFEKNLLFMFEFQIFGKPKRYEAPADHKGTNKINKIEALLHIFRLFTYTYSPLVWVFAFLWFLPGCNPFNWQTVPRLKVFIR